jgi:8-oxo-dGTP diphosphatase
VTGHRQALECVAALVLKEATVLAEKRKPTKRVVPGAVALPGGHVEPGESAEEALRRELKEELGIVPLEVWYVCTLLHRSAEFRKLHYFAVPRWEGAVENHEAASLRWVPLTASHDLDLEVDQLALAEYLRVYRDAGHARGTDGRRRRDDALPNHAMHRTGRSRRSPSGR